MRDKNLDLNTSADLPASDAGLTGGTNGALGGASKSDLERGFTDANEQCDAPTCEPMTNSDVRPGFCGRPNGWER